MRFLTKKANLELLSRKSKLKINENVRKFWKSQGISLSASNVRLRTKLSISDFIAKSMDFKGWKISGK